MTILVAPLASVPRSSRGLFSIAHQKSRSASSASASSLSCSSASVSSLSSSAFSGLCSARAFSSSSAAPSSSSLSCSLTSRFSSAGGALSSSSLSCSSSSVLSSARAGAAGGSGHCVLAAAAARSFLPVCFTLIARQSILLFGHRSSSSVSCALYGGGSTGVVERVQHCWIRNWSGGVVRSRVGGSSSSGVVGLVEASLGSGAAVFRGEEVVRRSGRSVSADWGLGFSRGVCGGRVCDAGICGLGKISGSRGGSSSPSSGVVVDFTSAQHWAEDDQHYRRYAAATGVSHRHHHPAAPAASCTMRSRAAFGGSPRGSGAGSGKRSLTQTRAVFAEGGKGSVGGEPPLTDLEKEKFKEVTIEQTNKLLTLPTVLTLARVAAVPAILAVFYSNTTWATAAGASIFVLAAITDWLDGYLARKMGSSSAFGAFLDPVADKLMVAAALVLLCTKPLAVPELATIPWLLPVPTIAIIGREITMSAVREWAATQGGDLHKAVAVNKLGKIKTASQMIAITLLLACGEGGLDSTVAGVLGIGLLYIAAGLALWSLAIYMRGIWGSMFK